MEHSAQSISSKFFDYISRNIDGETLMEESGLNLHLVNGQPLFFS